MSKVIPVLPAKNMSEQCAFYESIGFVVAKKYTAPPYAVVEYEDITIHFWVNKQQAPDENAICVFIEVDDVDHINELFTTNLKKALGKIPPFWFSAHIKSKGIERGQAFYSF